jgi:hypothetical protein
MIKNIFFIAFVFTLFGGCSNKLSLLAPYKESVSVYGLLNQDDSIQYIRIERVFLGEQNAYTMAQNQDSVYFKLGDIKVTLQRWKNDVQVSVDNPATSLKEIVLTDTLLQADAGIFNQNERVYKTKHKLYNDSEYRLIIHNNKSGKEFTSQTSLIGSFQLLISTNGSLNALNPNYPATFSLNITPSGNGVIDCFYGSPANSGVCGLIMRLNYTENNGGNTSQKYVDVDLGTNYPLQTAGGENQEFKPSGNAVLTNLAYLLPVNSSATRTIRGVDFLLTAGGQALALYNQVNASTSLSQSKANYTNISGGIGVFSCRNELVMKRKVTPQSVDTISASSITCKLRFVDEHGSLSICP